MKCSEVYDRLKTIGIPVAYHHFTKSPEIPFCVYLTGDRTQRGSDSINLLEEHAFRIELYTETKNEELENRILKAFNDKEIDIYETYIESEHLYQVVFEFEETVKLTGGN